MHLTLSIPKEGTDHTSYFSKGRERIWGGGRPLWSMEGSADALYFGALKVSWGLLIISVGFVHPYLVLGDLFCSPWKELSNTTLIIISKKRRSGLKSTSKWWDSPLEVCGKKKFPLQVHIKTFDKLFCKRSNAGSIGVWFLTFGPGFMPENISRSLGIFIQKLAQILGMPVSRNLSYFIFEERLRDTSMPKLRFGLILKNHQGYKVKYT